MGTRCIFQFSIASGRTSLLWAAVFVMSTNLASIHIQIADAQTATDVPQATATVTLDRVVAVVNHQAILSSDIEDELQLSVLDPSRAGLGELKPQRALQQLISRKLIEQQIRQDDIQAAEPSAEEVAARLREIQTELPICVRSNCGTESGWKAFLASHDLTPERVQSYLRNRLEVLRFIEVRFRQGIRISPEEIENYYREKLMPLYSPGQAIPPLDKVSPRIQEILLQQQVNILFDSWLENLRKQGEVEVVDPTLETAETSHLKGAGTE